MESCKPNTRANDPSGQARCSMVIDSTSKVIPLTPSTPSKTRAAGVDWVNASPAIDNPITTPEAPSKSPAFRRLPKRAVNGATTSPPTPVAAARIPTPPASFPNVP